MQCSNWNIAYAYDQLGNSKIISGTKGYSKIAQQIQKCGKASAKHIWEISQARHFGGNRGTPVFTHYTSARLGGGMPLMTWL